MLVDAALGALLLGLCLGTFATELTTAVALLVALLWGDRRAMGPWWTPVGLVAAAFAIAAATGPAADWREVLGRAWPLAPLLAVPALLAGHPAERRERLVTLGLAAAGLLGLFAAGQRLLFDVPAAGPFTHHLTLGYGLLPALAVAAARRRWLVAAGCMLGVFATGASGPLLSAVVVLAVVLLTGVVLTSATRLPPVAGLVGGIGTALALLVHLRGDAALAERLVLWRSGARLVDAQPWGTGPTGFREAASVAQQQLEPGFHFPLHAHDSVLQLGAVAGMGAWLALAVLAVVLWRRTDHAGRAALAGLAVGALTQDVFGDLEVARAAAVWLAFGAAAAPGSPATATALEPASVATVPSRAAPTDDLVLGGTPS